MVHKKSSIQSTKSKARRTLALYVHWPFCVSKCPYCDFNSHVRDHIDLDAWQAALILDLKHEHEVNKNVQIGTMFFGGGTPSLMPPQIVAKLIETADALWGLTGDCEITLEANPSSVEAARFADLAVAGVNRVSLGLQSLEPQALAFLGRAHSVSESLSALATAQSHFARVNIDLIYTRPDQNEAAWRDELGRAIALGTDHMSLYQLTIEPGTRFASDVRTGAFTPADDDTGGDLYGVTQEMTVAAGLPAYEISNHAASGQESRHNLSYWRYQDYAGIGPGAHGRRLNQATQRHKKPENFLSAVTRNGHGISSEELLDPATRATEALLMGLRLAEGVDLADIAARCELTPTCSPAQAGAQDCNTQHNTGLLLAQENTDGSALKLVDMAAVDHIASLGMIHRIGNHIRVTPKGMPLLDAILPQIVAVEAEAVA